MGSFECMGISPDVVVGVVDMRRGMMGALVGWRGFLEDFLGIEKERRFLLG